METSALIAILAGGQSRRMRTDKSFVPLNGKPMLQHVVDGVSQLNLPIILIANQMEKYTRFGLSIFSDVIPNAGSLGGLYTALQQGGAARTLCVACDMPFLNPSLLHFLIDQCIECDAVVPLVEGISHGLHAVYGQACLPIMRAKILGGDLAIHRVFSQVDTRFVGEDVLRVHDPSLRSLVNVNTPSELDIHRNEHNA